MGTQSTFLCSYTDSKRMQLVSRDSCVICYENERDALYMPCRHNMVCLRCSKQMRECPICREPISEFIRIYK